MPSVTSNDNSNANDVSQKSKEAGNITAGEHKRKRSRSSSRHSNEEKEHEPKYKQKSKENEEQQRRHHRHSQNLRHDNNHAYENIEVNYEFN